jgi:hypothetical protein
MDFSVFIITTVYNIIQFSIENFNIPILVINVLTLFSVILYIYTLKDKINALSLSKTPVNLTIQEIPLQETVFPSEKYEKLYENISIKNHQFIRSESVDDYLLECDIKNEKIEYKINNKHLDKIREKVKQNNIKFLVFLKNEFNKMAIGIRPLINEKKYSLATEIIPKENIEIYKSTYYDSILSNIISRKKIIIDNDGFQELFFDGATILPFSQVKDGPNRLKPIEHSRMNNHVGASVLGLTKDNYLVLFYQGSSTYIDTRSIVPSGNGSADWSDLRKTNGNFINAIKKSMERELIEEAMPLKNKAKIKTWIIGYFKWIEMLGKPQFIGLSKMDIYYDDVKAKEGLIKPIDEDQLYYFINNIDSLNNAVTAIQSKPRLNASLEYLLFRLEELIKKDNSIIKEWIDYKFE